MPLAASWRTLMPENSAPTGRGGSHDHRGPREAPAASQAFAEETRKIWGPIRKLNLRTPWSVDELHLWSLRREARLPRQRPAAEILRGLHAVRIGRRCLCRGLRAAGGLVIQGSS